VGKRREMMPRYRALYKLYLEGGYGSVEEARKDFQSVIKTSGYPEQKIVIEKYDEGIGVWMPLPGSLEET